MPFYKDGFSVMGPSEPVEPIYKPVDRRGAAQVARLLSYPSFNQTCPFHLNTVASRCKVKKGLYSTLYATVSTSINHIFCSVIYFISRGLYVRIRVPLERILQAKVLSSFSEEGTVQL